MKITDNNRKEIIEKYIRQSIDSMDLDALVSVVYDTMDTNLSKYTNAELENEISDYYPDLLETK
jgi:hypothetical protein